MYGGSADLVLSRAAGKVLDLRTARDRRFRADDERAALLNMQLAAHPGLAFALYGAGGGGHLMVRDTVAVCVSPPPVPFTLTRYVPAGVDDPTMSVMVEDPEPGAAIDAGLNAAVVAVGSPDALRAIAELKPPETVVVIVTVLVLLAP